MMETSSNDPIVLLLLLCAKPRGDCIPEYDQCVFSVDTMLRRSRYRFDHAEGGDYARSQANTKAVARSYLFF